MLHMRVAGYSRDNRRAARARPRTRLMAFEDEVGPVVRAEEKKRRFALITLAAGSLRSPPGRQQPSFATWPPTQSIAVSEGSGALVQRPGAALPPDNCSSCAASPSTPAPSPNDGSKTVDMSKKSFERQYLAAEELWG